MKQAERKRVSTGAKASWKSATTMPTVSPLIPQASIVTAPLETQAPPRTPTLPPLPPAPKLVLTPGIPEEARLRLLRQDATATTAYRKMLALELPGRLAALFPDCPEGTGRVHVVERAFRYLLGMKKGQGADVADVSICVAELFPDFRALLSQAQRYAMALDSGAPSRACPFCCQTVPNKDGDRDKDGPKDILDQPTGPRWHASHKLVLVNRLRQLMPVHFQTLFSQQPGDYVPTETLLRPRAERMTAT